MKKTILSACAALLLPLAAAAGEITVGSVPGTLNYQGRLERDNAPITGPIHLYFRVFNSATANNTGGGACGGVAQPCLWQSPEITVQAAQGIFSADLTPPLSVLSGGVKLYLEVQVESDVLAPREPLNSVAYALVAKKLEDGASVSVTTLTALNNVILSSAAGAYLTVGTDLQSSSARLTVDGSVKLVSGSLVFPDNTSMNTSGVGSASNISSISNADILADSGGGNTALSGDVLIRKASAVFMRITNSGKVGIGPSFTPDSGLTPPGGPALGPLLDVDGALYVGNEGIYDRDDSEVNIKQDLLVEGGKVTGMNAESISIGETNNIISFTSNGSERMRINSNNNVGIGLTAPSAALHVAGDIRANAGARGGLVSIGGYAGDWTGAANEVRADNATHLLLQQTNPYNVGIGTDTPREKLHVRGSVRSDYGVIAATGVFSGDVRVAGNLTANSGQGNTVNLSSTVIYGTLQVTGGIGSMAGIPAYLASTQTLTGQNTFLNQVVVSSDVKVMSRLGAGVVNFYFPGSRYLQVGGDENGSYLPNDDGIIYLIGGSNADAKLNFYRGNTLGATFATQGGSNLGLVVGGQVKTLTDAVYHRIQNSVVWISTGYATTPSIFVSSFMGNVGMGTSVLDPNHRLTVAGNLRISGSGNGLIFPDGTSLTTGNLGALLSVGNVSNNGDAVVQSNADLSGGGDVVLRAGSLDGLVLNTGGNVGIGTLFPVSKLNLRGGDLVLGTPYNPYSADSVEDLVVGGNIAFDGELVQRSAVPVYFSKLVVASDVYLSTTAGTSTGIGTRAPYTTFDVNGDAQFGSGIQKSTFTAAGVLQLRTALGVPYGGTGAATLTGVVRGNGAGAMTAMTGNTNYVTYWSDANTITAEQYLAVSRGGTGIGTLTGVIRGNGTGAMSAMTGNTNYVTYWSDANTITAEQYLAVSRGGTGIGTLTGVVKGNGAGAMSAMTGAANAIAYWSDANTITNSAILSHNGARLLVSGAADLTGSVTSASSGTFRASGAAQFSVETASGIKVNNGVIDMTAGKVVNVADPQFSQDAATKIYVDNQVGGGSSPAWSKYGNTVIGGNYMGSSNNADVIFARNGVANEKMRLISTGVDVTGDLTVSGTVDTYDISASGPNWDTAYTHSQDVTGGVHGATNANTGNMIVRRDASGNFSAGTITAALSGNATTSTNATNHIADVTGGVHGATNANTGNMIVRRDASGNFSAGTITATLSGNATTASGAPPTGAAGGNLGGNYPNPSIASLPAISGANLTSLTAGNISGQVAIGNGGTGASTQAGARTALGLLSMATQAANAVAITGGTISGGTISGTTLQLFSANKATLNGITPGALGEVYYCTDCSPVKVMVSTGTAQAQFGAITGGNFQ